MSKNNTSRMIAIFAAFLILTCFANATVGGASMQTKEIQSLVKKVKNNPTPMSRTEAAEMLAQSLKKVDPEKVKEQVLDDIIQLLESKEESVQAWIAVGLGNLGPRAKKAAPKLIRMLPEAERTDGSLTSASAIRMALTKMGVTPPPPVN